MDNAYNNTSTVQDPNGVSLPQDYKPNPEELKLLTQCRIESNVKGAVFATVTGGITYQIIKSFNLGINPKYGLYPKVGSACLIGFFLGKLASIPSCYAKFKNLPNSPIGAYMRQNTSSQGESLPIELAQATNLNFAVVNPTTKSPDNGQMNSAIDIDVYSSPSNMDSYTGDELNGPSSDSSNDNLPDQKDVQRPTVSYTELRQRNRNEYSKEREKYNLASSSGNEIPAEHSARRSSPTIPIEKKNQYGDVWE